MPKRRARDQPAVNLAYATTAELIRELRSRSLDFACFVSSPYKFTGFTTSDEVKFLIHVPINRPNFLITVRSLLDSHSPNPESTSNDHPL
ncbi:MAG: hypothetical protein ACK4Y5_20665 [Acetobacteraceae bacterium]|jgi:hypothetical protein